MSLNKTEKMSVESIKQIIMEELCCNPSIAKIIAMIIMFIFSFIIGCIPIKLCSKSFSKNGPHYNKVNCCLGFGAGVLIYIILHQVPSEMKREFQTNNNEENEVQATLVIMCTGFFFMYLVEECLFFYLLQHKERNISIYLTRSCSVICDLTNFDVQHSTKNPFQKETLIFDLVNSISKSIRSLLIVLALSLYSLFEGLAIGMESNATQIWYTLTVIGVAKLITAFCLGLDLISSSIKNTTVTVYVLIFAVVSPIGIGVGAILNSVNKSSIKTISVPVKVFGTGALLFVVFFEIMFGERRRGFRQFLSVLAGLTVMFVIGLIELNIEEKDKTSYCARDTELFSKQNSLFEKL